LVAGPVIEVTPEDDTDDAQDDEKSARCQQGKQFGGHGRKPLFLIEAAAFAFRIIESVVRKLQENRRARGRRMRVPRILRFALFPDGATRYNTANWVQGPGRGRDVARFIHPFALPLSPVWLVSVTCGAGPPQRGGPSAAIFLEEALSWAR